VQQRCHCRLHHHSSHLPGWWVSAERCVCARVRARVRGDIMKGDKIDISEGVGEGGGVMCVCVRARVFNMSAYTRHILVAYIHIQTHSHMPMYNKCAPACVRACVCVILVIIFTHEGSYFTETSLCFLCVSARIETERRLSRTLSQKERNDLSCQSRKVLIESMNRASILETDKSVGGASRLDLVRRSKVLIRGRGGGCHALQIRV
jgi:hypothetical protein